MNSDGQPSFTALTAAAARAAHLIVDDEPRIFTDPLAAALLGDRAGEFIGYHRAHGTHPVLAGARAQVTCRSRYTEDRLADAVSRGITQYVILGAGLDSFASRGGRGKVRVFEVDHPATQDWKRRIAPVRDNAEFVPMDFATGSLGDRLRDAGFDPGAPAFVSWLGVTMYLTADAIGKTLSGVGDFAAGSEIVVDYLLPADLRDDAGHAYADLVAPASAERGEPWLSTFSPDAMAAMLADRGFGLVRHVRQHDMVPAGLWNRSDSLRPADLFRIAHATAMASGRRRSGRRRPGDAR
jgi:methyltransferase (TIGR00027 family)